MLSITCSGSPFEIGFAHGFQAKAQTQSSIAFYFKFFQEMASLTIDEVCTLAQRFIPLLENRHPDLFEEMKGVAEGADVPLNHILALNVRTEISYGMAVIQGLDSGAPNGIVDGKSQVDGCTAVSWHGGDVSLLGQNWDWRQEQSSNLVKMKIEPADPSRARFEMITEAGLIGKIGLNSFGLGVCLNAIRAPGVDYSKLPVHLALRRLLDSAKSVEDATSLLQAEGVASSAHILIADSHRAIGIETSVNDLVTIGEQVIGSAKTVSHTNHYIEKHKEVSDGGGFIDDSWPRLDRIRHLARRETHVGIEEMKGWLKDEEGLPSSICRQTHDESGMATLFSIVLDLKNRKGYVKMGRPTENGEEVKLEPAIPIRRG